MRFKNVDFTYQQDAGNALTAIQFDLLKGKVLGITGPTGSGKSTLINLIPRFYNATSGGVYVYGLPVSEFSLESLRKQVGIVPQNSSLFTGSIAENLRWGKADATDEDIQEALEIAQSADFVNQLPEGIHSPVFEGGKNFSGGQRQRLTIARALIAKPAILILDDSLSALDYQTDLNLRQALRQRLNDTTLVIVSQRISSIQSADEILVLNDGKMAAKGTHQDLLAHSQMYQDFYYSQNEANGGADNA